MPDRFHRDRVRGDAIPAAPNDVEVATFGFAHLLHSNAEKKIDKVLLDGLNIGPGDRNDHYYTQYPRHITSVPQVSINGRQQKELLDGVTGSGTAGDVLAELGNQTVENSASAHIPVEVVGVEVIMAETGVALVIDNGMVHSTRAQLQRSLGGVGVNTPLQHEPHITAAILQDPSSHNIRDLVLAADELKGEILSVEPVHPYSGVYTTREVPEVAAVEGPEGQLLKRRTFDLQ